MPLPKDCETVVYVVFGGMQSRFIKILFNGDKRKVSTNPIIVSPNKTKISVLQPYAFVGARVILVPYQ